MGEILCPMLSEIEDAFTKLRQQNRRSQPMFRHTITEPFGLKGTSRDLYSELPLQAGSALNSGWAAQGFVCLSLEILQG